MDIFTVNVFNRLLSISELRDSGDSLRYKRRYENFPGESCPNESFPMKISQSESFPKVKISQVLNKE
jgi:hypothetical protein